MLALVHWASRREAATALSTGEAERVAGADCARSTFPVAAILFFLQLCTASNSARTALSTGTGENCATSKKSTNLSKFRHGQHS